MKNPNTGKNRIIYRIVMILIVITLLSSNTLQIALAQTEEPPEEYRGETIPKLEAEGSAVIQENSFGIAWGDPDGPHSVYAWPFTFVQMGHAIQSYQNYSSGTSAAYFHHGIDMIAPNGTQVFTRSGGQVVNIENYQPGQAIYWEVAILDEEGYVWQYHHIDQTTIPQLIYNKFAEWQANPETGGYVPPNTHIGNIVYWPVVSMGYRFNHVHLNILAAGDIYLNTMEFHTPIEDTQAPEIQAIGLLNGDTVLSGNTASGNYGMYVRARDLYKSTVYYLPPYKTGFSIDGGDWVTVWEFHDFPGGFDDDAYVNDFFVPVYTRGDYNYRDFYIDLGFTTEGQRAFPSEPGEHSIEVCVWDYYGNNSCDSFSWNVVTAIPDNGCGSGNGVTRTFQVTEDLLVTDVNLGVNLTHPSRGQVRVTLKSPTDTTATTIINTSTDTYDNYDLWVDDSSGNPVNDGNNDSVSAPYFDRTAGPSVNGALDSFNGKAAYGEWTVFVCDNASGTTGTVNLINLEVIGVNSDNEPPIANALNLSKDEDETVEVTLGGSDPDGDTLTFSVVDQPGHGSLSGTAPDLTYTPSVNYNGSDSFTFKVNDGSIDSNIATVSITINPVNDGPVAQNQTYYVEMNSSLWVTLKGEDVENDPLTFELLSEPIHGSLRGNLTNLLYTPSFGYIGDDNFTFRVKDGVLNSELATVSITVNPPEPVTIFYDNFESDLGWAPDPDGDDSATTGMWERADPEAVVYNGYKQLGDTVSGTHDLVTGHLAGSGAGDYDIDGGDTTISSPEITLPLGRELTLSFSYYLAHSTNATSDDYLRVTVEGAHNQQVFEELGAANDDDATWENFSGDINDFTGQTGTLFIAAADAGAGSLVEAAIDDILILATKSNETPTADAQFLLTTLNTPKSITLTGSDGDNDSLTYNVVTEPLNGSLSGSGSNLIYTPKPEYYGYDYFEFVSQDNKAVSMPAVVTLFIANPTSANILYFTAGEKNTDIVIRWATSTEVDVLGFNLFRSTSTEGERIKINSDLIIAGNPGGVEGQDYSYVDPNYDIEDDLLFYYLEVIDLYGGHEFYGPVEIDNPYRNNLELPYMLFVPIIQN